LDNLVMARSNFNVLRVGERDGNYIYAINKEAVTIQLHFWKICDNSEEGNLICYLLQNLIRLCEARREQYRGEPKVTKIVDLLSSFAVRC